MHQKDLLVNPQIVEAIEEALRDSDRKRLLELAHLTPRAEPNEDPAVSPIVMAVFAGRADLGAWIVENGAPSGPVEAAVLGRTDRLRAILTETKVGLKERTERINRVDGSGWTMLHLAAFFGHENVARLLLELGATPNANSANQQANTPIHAALAGRGGRAMVQLLLDFGADPDTTAAGGVHPIHLAASRNDREAVELLLLHRVTSTRLDDGRLSSDVAEERGHNDLAHYLRAVEQAMWENGTSVIERSDVG